MRTPKIARKTEYFPIIGGQVKATNDQQGIIEGYLNYIGNIDYGDDRTMPGAFKRTITDSFSRKRQQGLDYLWPYLWNHDYSLIPPGGIFDADETKSGLYIKTQFNLDMQMGRELYSSFKKGTLKKQSMGYKSIRDEYVKDAASGRMIRNLLEVAIMEGSAVVFPMNDMATVDVVKNLSGTGRRYFVMPGTQVQQRQRKDFNDRYRQQVIADWAWSDWYNLTTALKQSIQDAFASGDTPETDLVDIILNDGPDGPGFITALKAYVQEGIDLDYANYLQEQAQDTDDEYGWMSDDSHTPEAKAGRVLSDANHKQLTKAMDGIQGHVDNVKSLLKSAQPQKDKSSMGASSTPLARDEKNEESGHEEVDAGLSTQLDELLATLTISNLTRKG